MHRIIDRLIDKKYAYRKNRKITYFHMLKNLIERQIDIRYFRKTETARSKVRLMDECIQRAREIDIIKKKTFEYMFPVADQTAGPNVLTFFEETQGYPSGKQRLNKIPNFIFFQHFFFNSTGNAGHLASFI